MCLQYSKSIFYNQEIHPTKLVKVTVTNHIFTPKIISVLSSRNPLCNGAKYF